MTLTKCWSKIIKHWLKVAYNRLQHWKAGSGLAHEVTLYWVKLSFNLPPPLTQTKGAASWEWPPWRSCFCCREECYISRSPTQNSPCWEVQISETGMLVHCVITSHTLIALCRLYLTMCFSFSIRVHCIVALYNTCITCNQVKELEQELEELKTTTESVKSQLEAETLSKVDLQNNIQSLREELAFKKKMYEEVGGNSKLSVSSLTWG